MRRREIALALAGLAAGLALMAWWLSPRVQAWAPSGSELAALGPLVLSFNRPPDEPSARDHFSVTPPLNGRLELNGRELTFWPVEPLIYGQTYTFTIRAGLRGSNGLPSLSAARRGYKVRAPRLVFLRQEGELANVWLWTGDGGERQLTDESTGVWDYSVTPDGQGLVIASIDQDGSDDLVLVDEQGKRLLLLECTQSQCRQGRWQPGGRLLAYERLPLGRPATETEVWLLDVDSGQTWAAHDPDLLTTAGYASRSSRFPRWSADGRLLAYFKPDARIIVVLDMAGGEPALIPANLQLMGEWSPVAPVLAYTELTFGAAQQATPGDSTGESIPEAEPALVQHVVVTDLATGESNDLSQGKEVEDGLPTWSPDGQALAAARSTGAARQLWILGLAEGVQRQLTDEPLAQHTAPAWSPNGRRLAYMRSGPAPAGGQAEIWLMELPGGDKTLVAAGAFLPGWWP